MKLRGSLSPDHLRETWIRTLRDTGLGRVHCGKHRYRWEPVDPRLDTIAMEVVPAAQALDDFLTGELNRAFAGDGTVPFRAFLKHEQDGSWIGVVYHHWVADSWSIRRLLREWLARIHNPAAASGHPFPMPDKGYWRLFGPDAANWSFWDAFCRSACATARFKKARRIPVEAFADFSTNYSTHEPPRGTVYSLRRVAKKRNATLNDLFLAALALVCSSRLPADLTPRRSDLALGTIVDLRNRGPVGDRFGLYLGYTNLVLRPRELEDPRTLLDYIAAQNRRMKSLKVAEQSMIRMAGGLVFHKLMKPQSLLEFYRKRFSLYGGISNVNLDPDWPGTDHPRLVTDYLRASPAGPTLPIVVTTSTLGGELRLGLTCRNSLVPPHEAPSFANAFLEQLRKLG
jgi:NRPS condensation-like uncharacterized protein